VRFINCCVSCCIVQKPFYMLTKRAAPPMRAPMATAAVGMAPALSSVALLAAAPALLEIAPALEVREAIWSWTDSEASARAEVTLARALVSTVSDPVSVPVSLSVSAEAVPEESVTVEASVRVVVAPVASLMREETSSPTRVETSSMMEETSPTREETSPMREETSPAPGISTDWACYLLVRISPFTCTMKLIIPEHRQSGQRGERQRSTSLCRWCWYQVELIAKRVLTGI
jgi:hypothetical protein